MPPPLHSPWSRWVSWIFKDIPTLLSIWAPSAQPLMFNADRHTGLEASKALCGLWTRSGQYCLQKGTMEQDSCISVLLHIIEKTVHVYPQILCMFSGQSPVVLWKKISYWKRESYWSRSNFSSQNEMKISLKINLILAYPVPRKQAHTRHVIFKKSH